MRSARAPVGELGARDREPRNAARTNRLALARPRRRNACKFDAAAIRTFRAVERLIGLVQHSVGVATGRKRDPDACADLQLRIAHGKGTLERLADAATEAERGVGVADAVGDDDELVTTDACDEIDLAHRGTDPQGRGPQQLVAEP